MALVVLDAVRLSSNPGKFQFLEVDEDAAPLTVKLILVVAVPTTLTIPFASTNNLPDPPVLMATLFAAGR